MTTAFQEALTAVGASALIQKEIDPLLLEYQRRYANVVRAITSQKWGSNVYYFNQRTNQPAGGFVTDGGARPVSTSTYVQNQYTIRNLQSVGAVTGYAQAVTQDLIGNLRAREIEGAAKGLYWDIEVGVLWGNSASTLNGAYPEYDGLDTIAAQFSGPGQNAINFNQGNFSLGTLDQLIDMVEQNVSEDVESADWFFAVSPTVNSRISQLLLNQQRFIGSVEVATGLIVPSYRDIPFLKSSFLSPRGVQMNTVSSSVATTGGTLNSGGYVYKVSAIVARFGEILASAEVPVTVGGSNAGIVTLSFTPPSYENSAPLSYKVFRGPSSGTETLLGYVAADIFAANGVTVLQINQIVDNGSALIGQNSVGPVAMSPAPTQYFGTNTGMQPLSAGSQSIYLVSRNQDFVVRPYVREMQPIDVYPTTASPDSLPFAFVADTTLAVRAPKYLGRAANVVVELSN